MIIDWTRPFQVGSKQIMLSPSGWHTQAHFSLCLHWSAGDAEYVSSNPGRRLVTTGQLFVVMDEQACGHDQWETGLTDPLKRVVERWLRWLQQRHFGGWDWRRSPRLVDLGLMKHSVMIPWPGVTVDNGSVKARKFQQNWYRLWLCHHFFGYSGNLLPWEPIWICSQRQGWPIGGNYLSWGGSGRSDRGREDGRTLLLTGGSSIRGSWLGFVDGVEESQEVVLVWPSAA